MIYNTALPVIFGVKKYADALQKVVADRWFVFVKNYLKTPSNFQNLKHLSQIFSLYSLYQDLFLPHLNLDKMSPLINFEFLTFLKSHCMLEKVIYNMLIIFFKFVPNFCPWLFLKWKVFWFPSYFVLSYLNMNEQYPEHQS